MYWKREKSEYEILIPPLDTFFMEMTSQEAKDFFEWYMEQIPKRIKYLSRYCCTQLKINSSELDLSPKSLILLWRWFLKIAKTERTPQKQLDAIYKSYQRCPIELQKYMINEAKEQFSLQTEFIIRDIAMYIGAVFEKNNPRIHWGYYEEPKTDFFVNVPSLLGFEDGRFNPPFKMSFEPVHMVGVQAANIWDKTCNEKDLYNLYNKWLKFVPDTNL